jgi:hypothetical protein
VYRYLDGAVDHEGNPAVVSVQPDKVYPALGVIHDDKTWNYLPRGGEGYKAGEIHPVEVKDAYRLQLSIGAWAWDLPAKAVYPDGTTVVDPEPLGITEGQLTFRDGSGQIRIKGIELFPFDALEDYMRGRVAELNKVRSGQEPAWSDIPEDHRKFCATCPVLYLCQIPREEYAKKRVPTKPKPSRPKFR